VLALNSCPLLEKFGRIPELTSMVCSHLNDKELYSVAQVCHLWYKQAVRYLWHWHTPTCDERLLASSLVDSRINVHAASVRHLTFTTSIYMIPADYYAAVSDAIRNNTPVPEPYSVSDDSDSASAIGNDVPERKVSALFGLTRFPRDQSSLSRRPVNVLASIFVPTSKLQDHC
jgi:hypothetical protein